MKIAEVDKDLDHKKQLQKTGYYGHRGAGCLFQALDTGRICIAHRANLPKHLLQEPNTWGTWGGTIDPGESAESAVLREVQEEAGYTGKTKLLPMYVFQSPTGFVYYNFLALVKNEFLPRLNWENQGYIWTLFGQWPSPLHPGLRLLLKDLNSVALMEKYSVK